MQEFVLQKGHKLYLPRKAQFFRSVVYVAIGNGKKVSGLKKSCTKFLAKRACNLKKMKILVIEIGPNLLL